MSQDNNEAASADLISRIVDRDTPPDGRNDVVDHDLRGNPITRGMVDSMAKAASASQSSTSVPRVGGPDDLIGKLRSTLYAIANTLDDSELRSAAQAAYELAHVARQRQESVDYKALKAIFDRLDPHRDAVLWGIASEALGLGKAPERAAVAEGVDTPLPPLPRCDASYHNGRFYSAATMQAYATTYGAQQREAGRLEEREKQAGLTRQPVLASPKA